MKYKEENRRNLMLFYRFDLSRNERAKIDNYIRLFETILILAMKKISQFELNSISSITFGFTPSITFTLS